MEFVWQSSDAPTRKRTSQDDLVCLPCSTCRARKKRCYHVEEAENARQPEKVERQPQAAEVVVETTITREASPSPGPVSVYNPESVLEDLSKPPEPKASIADAGLADQSPQNGGGSAHNHQSPSAAQKFHREMIRYKRHRWRATPLKLSEHHRGYLQEVGALLELPRTTTDALLPIYVSLLDDLIPIVNGTAVFRENSNGHASIYLVRAICLVTCKSKQAAPFLRLTADGPVLEPLKFASKLVSGLDVAIRADLEPDRVTKIQILALMHLHSDGMGGVIRASGYLSQAITEAWAMSLHWDIPGNEDQEQCDMLWWTLRNFDRLNKPIMNASPFIIDDTDVAIARITPKPNNYRSQIMAVSLTLGDLMSKATRLYKATSKATVDDCEDWPMLSDVISGTSFNSFHRSHRAYLEVWYHVAAMLSCRFSGPGTTPYNRRLASADRILEIISRGGYESLPPLPLVPYAMSMSTTMIYQALREDQREFDRAYRDLGLCCEALDALSKRWTSARGVTKLAQRLWRLLTQSGTKKGRHAEDKVNELPSRKRARSEAAMALVNMNSSSPVTNEQRRNTEAVNLHPLIVPPPIDVSPIQYNSSPNDGQIPHHFQGHPAPNPYHPAVDASYSQLDREFHDLFDYGMPNFFRDPMTWEYIHSAQAEDASSGGGSEFQFSTYLTSPLDFGYSQLPHMGGPPDNSG